jgi:NhaP-type Na+/H+ or K+/H+ antiporter
MYENLAMIGAFVFLYSILSGGLERTPINGALVFTVFGLIMGPLALDLLKIEVEAESLKMLAEATLALVLFIDASNADFGTLKQNFKIPSRLLLVGLPLTILLGFGAGVLIFDGMGLLEVALIATLLAPTDAALGKAVVSNKAVPANIRESLSVESGLNDGICVPILFLFLALATGTAEGSTQSLALKLLAEEIGIGMAVGLGLTALAVCVMKITHKHGWITETWRQLPVVSLALVCFATAQCVGGSGFIAAFTGGLLFGALAKDAKHRLLIAAEGTGDTLSLITWVAFGVAVVGHSIGSICWQPVVYAILSLTVIRMLPVFLSLTGLKIRTDEKLFMGWFGPRGLASIVFAVIVLNADLPNAKMISLTAVWTIGLSVLGHGLSANPLIKLLAARLKKEAPEPV